MNDARKNKRYVMSDIHIRLNMIVKDEAPNIRGALESAAKVIDSFCIVDTGSRDDTIGEIKKWAESTGMSGEVLEETWIDFGTNRALALNHAVRDQRPSHVVFLDADDRMMVRDNFSKKHLQIGSSYRLTNLSGTISYRLPQLIAVGAVLKWEWKAPLHEYLEPVNHVPNFAELDTVIINKNVVPGGRTKDVSQREKYLRDACTLEEYLADHPDDSRSQYYLGQSYRDAQEWRLAISSYSKRVAMSGWDQETYHAMLQIGLCHEHLNQTGNALAVYLDAWKFRKKRRDALYHIIRILRLQENYEIANLFVDFALSVPPSHGDTHFIDRGASEWRFFDEASIVRYWTGDYKSSLAFALEALTYDKWESEKIARIEKNAQFAREALLGECPNVGAEILGASKGQDTKRVDDRGS